MFVRLEAKSHKGKNRLRERGDIWRVVTEHDKVPCLDNRAGFLIEPVSLSTHVSSTNRRWIEKENDRDFTIVGFLEDHEVRIYVD